MKQTYAEAVIKTVLWWMDKAFHTKMNQNNGDDSTAGGMTFILMNQLAMSAQYAITKDQEKMFEQKLTELLMNARTSYEKRLDVDYGPCDTLASACDYAGIDVHCLPCKTDTWIDQDNLAFASYQYRGTTVEL